MNYENILGNLVRFPISKRTIPRKRGTEIKNLIDKQPIREKCPSLTVKRDECSKDIASAISTYMEEGMDGIPKVNQPLRYHLTKFRACLLVYDRIVDKKVFSIEELYLRCLTEGIDFTNFIKKSRQQSLQLKIAEGLIEVDDEYSHDEYSGYDSILNERYLIPWDDTDDIEDWIWSMEEAPKVPEDAKDILLDMFNDLDLSSICINDTVDIHGSMKGSKSALLNGLDETTYLRNIRTDEYAESYVATRRVVPVYPGGTRDTGVGDALTLHKVQRVNAIARSICDSLPYSANTSNEKINSRINRIRKGKAFLHLDFKKFGLTAPRESINNVLELVGKPELKVNEFILKVEDEQYYTNKGTVLGWFDSMIAVTICSIIHKIRKKDKKLDFIIFNDDVEITYYGKNAIEKLLQYRSVIIHELEKYGFIISHRKTYVSKEMIFLEQYYKFKDDFDMNKTQLMIKPYVEALTTQHKWVAKLEHARANQYCPDDLLSDMIINSMKPEFNKEEVNWPVQIGGWKFHIEDGRDTGLELVTAQQLFFFDKLRNFKSPHLTKKMVEITTTRISLNRDKIIKEATKTDLSAMGLKVERDTPISITEDEIDAIFREGMPEENPQESNEDLESDEDYEPSDYG